MIMIIYLEKKNSNLLIEQVRVISEKEVDILIEIITKQRKIQTIVK